jgi:predicted nuclease with TOPRIM domain
MGSTTVERQRLVDVERAAARDDEETKKREEEMERMADLVKENKQVKDLNNKMMSLLEGLKEEVQKINISNAKLLYTNKALGNISLNERQKNQIVESISKADSVLAAKTIYETLQNAVETASIPKEAPQALRETLNRAQSPFVVKKTAANSISDIMAERMKALAGIKK